MRRPFAEEQLDELEAFEPEPYDSGQRKRFLRCQSERLRRLYGPPKGACQSGSGGLQEIDDQVVETAALVIGKPVLNGWLTVPELTYALHDPEDLDTNQHDHVAKSLRYIEMTTSDTRYNHRASGTDFRT